ncbi:glycyl-radical enzyme activating protein [Chloroflexota bacterium]
MVGSISGIIYNIQDYCIHDGPGIRTTVFFKGCPLRCAWCSNPESMSMKPEMGFIKENCIKCGKCVTACPQKATTLGTDGFPRIDRRLCTGCGACVEVCDAGARIMYGAEITAEQLFEEVRKDEIFYRGSGGGVTVSGGEPLLQPKLLSALFQLCRGADIHTAIQTSGYAAAATLKKILALTDYIMFDLKHLDSQMHRKYTGKPNRLILNNARLVAGSKIPVLFRMPLIPGVNDNPENIEATAHFIRGLSEDAMHLELMPYHRLATGKYGSLGRPYFIKEPMPTPPELDHIETVRANFEQQGLVCTVSS